ncbi:hypothetical protein Acr_05g0012470 [Actinidia rufa]|uniref:Uncharacterized protein n=1 Tax=Actinidia rufa TaxID=165716 RepID=A0A7J0EMB7_9ERIC|nr:hypothetical protein Acr_05g0012470 [Actinidia rufa]
MESLSHLILMSKGETETCEVKTGRGEMDSRGALAISVVRQLWRARRPGKIGNNPLMVMTRSPLALAACSPLVLVTVRTFGTLLLGAPRWNTSSINRGNCLVLTWMCNDGDLPEASPLKDNPSCHGGNPEARPGKNLLKGFPNNVKGWKKRFFFVLGDALEFFPRMSPGEGIPSSSKVMGHPRSSWPRLPKRLRKRRLPLRMQASTAVMATPTSKGIVIQEKRSRNNSHNSTLNKKGKVNDSKGKDAMPHPRRPNPTRGRAMWLGNRRHRGGFVHLAGQKFRSTQHRSIGYQVLPCPWPDHQNDFFFQLAYVDAAELEMVKAQNQAFKADNQLAALGEQAMKADAKLKDKLEAMAKLEAKLAHHDPNLGIDLVSMETDTNLAEEGEAAEVSEKGEENDGEIIP